MPNSRLMRDRAEGPITAEHKPKAPRKQDWKAPDALMNDFQRKAKARLKKAEQLRRRSGEDLLEDRPKVYIF